MPLEPRSWITALPSIARAIRKAWRALKEDRLPMSPAWWWRALCLHLTQEQERAAGLRSSSGRFDRHRLIESYRRALDARASPTSFDDPTLPHLSIVCLAEDATDISRIIKSIQSQPYARWTLWLVGASPTIDDRVRHLPSDDQIGRLITPPDDDWVVMLDGSSVLAEGALGQLASAARDSSADWIYTDNDRLDDEGLVTDPELKGEFSRELALVDDYATRLAVVSKSCIAKAGGLRTELGAAQLQGLLLRSADAGATVEHLAIIGCHRLRPAPALRSEAHRRAGAESLARRGVVASLEQAGGQAALRVRWSPSTIETTIVIPVRNRIELLRRCLESLIRTVDPSRTRVVVADDESNEPEMLEFLDQLPRDSPLRCSVLRVPRQDRAFNYARLVNAAAATVDTPLMLHLNNDIEAIERGWLEQMAGWLDLDGVGVVGARLLAANGTVQHAGVFLREGREPEHLFTGLEGDDAGYQSLAARARNVSAVTGACLLTRTELYRSLRGFDERGFAVQFGDVDYCLRVSDIGRRVVYEPAATLRHEGSATRGNRYDPAENAAYIERHGHRRERFHSALLAAASLSGPTPLVSST